jgi:excisionase family DNA binding protein
VRVTEWMSTREVAEYLRIKERKVYDLLRDGRIPATRVTGKWLFSKALIDQWLARSTVAGEAVEEDRRAVPPTVAGSHDPLLEWSLRESQCRLALMAGGSLDGLERLAAGEAMVGAIHVLDAASGEYNVPLVRERLGGRGFVVIEWAWRDQGLVVAAGNPMAIASIADLALRRARVVCRQEAAGSQLLFNGLLADAGIDPGSLTLLPRPARSELDVALAIREGKADAGLAVAAVARQVGLSFLSLRRERFDLVLRRRDYFEPPVQSLLAFARSEPFLTRAAEFGGYDVAGLGRVVYNGP